MAAYPPTGRRLHAFDRNLDERLIRASPDSAQSELDTVAELLGRDDYRPAHYLPGSLA
ncbi:hypothetical protein SAMN04489732_13338 [Amycolatopsis saalfeldensis]|uniref:Uncharacterized protein n=1 Tax=Amycolatopsis saalfeldensis TaxID=394193 RepID=A0A1H8YPA8_9PSEU|nr:hypothetical protein SAMN04489732_13338 [Amycolatopsis saalfeldensis]